MSKTEIRKLDEALDLDDMVNRFLRWPLPASVCSDTCVSDRNYPHGRSGTNLLTAQEARAMLRFVVLREPVQGPPQMGEHCICSAFPGGACDGSCYVDYRRDPANWPQNIR